MRIIFENIFEILLSGVEWIVLIRLPPFFKRNHQFRVHILNSENPNNAKLTPAPLHLVIEEYLKFHEKLRNV